MVLLVSRIPLDLLDRRRCGLRIAVNVIPQAHARAIPQRGERLRAAAARFMGIPRCPRARVGASRLVARRIRRGVGGHPDRAACDSSGYDFDAFEAIVESGRLAARERIGLVTAAVENLIGDDGGRSLAR